MLINYNLFYFIMTNLDLEIARNLFLYGFKTNKIPPIIKNDNYRPIMKITNSFDREILIPSRTNFNLMTLIDSEGGNSFKNPDFLDDCIPSFKTPIYLIKGNAS